MLDARARQIDSDLVPRYRGPCREPRSATPRRADEEPPYVATSSACCRQRSPRASRRSSSARTTTTSASAATCHARPSGRADPQRRRRQRLRHVGDHRDGPRRGGTPAGLPARWCSWPSPARSADCSARRTTPSAAHSPGRHHGDAQPRHGRPLAAARSSQRPERGAVDRRGRQGRVARLQRPRHRARGPGAGRSDDSSFLDRRVPAINFFTGFHGDYHRPGDDWERIDLQGTAQSRHAHARARSQDRRTAGSSPPVFALSRQPHMVLAGHPRRCGADPRQRGLRRREFAAVSVRRSRSSSWPATATCSRPGCCR